jgi:ATP-dependent DNA ligase
VLAAACFALALDGDDLRKLPPHLRKTNLARLLARRSEGIFVSDLEQGEIGPGLFRQACKFGLEGLVSKHKDRPYRAGRSPDWIKVKNRSHPALGEGQGVVFVTNKDAFDLWWAWAEKPPHSTLTIPARYTRR